MCGSQSLKYVKGEERSIFNTQQTDWRLIFDTQQQPCERKRWSDLLGTQGIIGDTIDTQGITSHSIDIPYSTILREVRAEALVEST